MKIKIFSLIIVFLFICTTHTSFASGDIIGIIEINQQGIKEDIEIYGSLYVDNDQQLKDNIPASPFTGNEVPSRRFIFGGWLRNRNYP